MLLFQNNIITTRQYKIYSMKGWHISINIMSTYQLWSKLKRRRVSPSFLKWKEIYLLYQTVPLFCRKAKPNYQMVKHPIQNQNVMKD